MRITKTRTRRGTVTEIPPPATRARPGQVRARAARRAPVARRRALRRPPAPEHLAGRRRRRRCPRVGAHFQRRKPLAGVASRGCAPRHRRPCARRRGPGGEASPRPAERHRARTHGMRALDRFERRGRSQRFATACLALPATEPGASRASDSQSLATLVAPTLERQATRARPHAVPKAVGASALALLRLIRALHATRECSPPLILRISALVAGLSPSAGFASADRLYARSSS